MNQWLEKVDPKSGRTYWGNTKTKVTTWKEPEELRLWRQTTEDDAYWECVDKRTGKAYYINQRTRESTWHRPLGNVEPYKPSKGIVSTERQRASEKTIDIEEKEHHSSAEAREAKSDSRDVQQSTKPRNPQARSSASILEGGVIEGIALYRSAETGDYEEVILRLESGKLTCNRGDTVLATYLLHVAQSVLLSDSSNVLRLFEIELAFADTSKVSVAFSDIRDVLLWLEALQLSMQRGKVFESLKETSKSTTGARDSGLRLETSEDILTKLTEKRNNSNGDTRQSYRILSAVSSHHHRKFIGHGAALSIQRGFRVKRQAGGGKQETEKNITFMGWLQEHGIECFEKKIREAGYDDLELLSKLTEQDLKEFLLNDIKIEKPGHRMKVYVAVRLLAKQRPGQPDDKAGPSTRTRARAKTSGGF